ncbi:unnamed protein product, partial [marine sediment metagenome]
MNFSAAPFPRCSADTLSTGPAGSIYQAADNNKDIFSGLYGPKTSSVKLGGFPEYLGPEAIVLLGSD